MLGNESGYSNTSGEYNVFMGFQSGNQNDNGASNTFIGYQTGYSNTTASFNTFIGYRSGLNYTTGQYNTFIGYKAGLADTLIRGTGNNNVALGYLAGTGLTFGDDNVVIGSSAGSNLSEGMSNILIGTGAGQNLTTGWKNVAVGWYAGAGLTTNSQNTLIGNKAGERLVSGSENVYVGNYAGQLTSSGKENTFLGYDCGLSNETGTGNTYLGYFAGRQSHGDYNVFVGRAAGMNEDGSYKLYIHYNSSTTPLIWGDMLNGIATIHGKLGISTKTPGYTVEGWGNNAALIAHYSGQSRGGVSALLSNRVSLLTTNTNDDLVFGYSTDINQANFSTAFVERMRIDNGTGNVGIGTTSPSQKLHVVGNVYASGNVSASYLLVGTSSTYAPLHVQKWEGTVAVFNRRNTNGDVVEFWRGDPDGTKVGSVFVTTTATTYNTTSDKRLKNNIADTKLGLNNLMQVKVRDFSFKNDPTNKIFTGFIAQELYEIYPDAVTKPENDNGIWQVDYGRITPLLVKAIQDQQQQIDTLKEENSSLKQKVKEIDELKAELEAIKALIKK